MATRADEIRAFAERYAAEVAPPEGTATPAPAGTDLEQDVRNFASQYAMGNLPPAGSMRAPEIRDFAEDYQAEINYADEFARGFGQGTDMLQASLYAMTRTLGRELGLDVIEEFGDKGMMSNIEEMSKFGPTQARFTEIDSMDEFFRWAAGAFGQAIPSLGAAMAGGGLGGALMKKAVEKSIYGVVRDRMLRQMAAKSISAASAESAVDRALRSRAGADLLRNGFQNGNAQLLQRGFAQGATIGAMIPSSAMQAGETEMNLAEAGIDGSLLSVFGTGLAGGALEAAPALRLIDKMFPGVDKAVAGSFIKDFAKATGTQAVLEGSTEGAQEMIQLASLAWHDPSFDMLNPENAMQVLDAFAAGALVGAVTGGGAAGVGRLTAQDEGAPGQPPGYRPNLPGGPAPESERLAETEAPEIIYPEGFEPANNTVFEEVKRQTQDIIDEKLQPAMNKLTSSFNNAQDRVRGHFASAGIVSPYAGMEKYRQAVAEGQDEFLAGHQPILDDTVRYAAEYAMYVAEEAAGMPEAQQQAFIEEQMAELSAEVGKVAVELGLRGDKMIGSVVSEIENDPIYDMAPPDPDQVETEFVFGQMFAYKDEQGTSRRYRTRGENARPYPTYEAAANNLESVQEKYPSAPASAWSIRGNDETGYTIAINDSGIRQQLRDDEVVSESLELARVSARGHKNEGRKVKVKFPGRKGQTIIDLPTLVFEGRRIGDGDTQTTEQAFEGMMARLFERRVIDDAAYTKMREAFDEQFPGREKKYTLRQAKRIRDSKKYKKAREKDMRETTSGDTALADPGITGDTDMQFSFRKGVKGSGRISPRATGKRAGEPRFQEETERALTEGRPFGAVEDNRPVRRDTDPEADTRGFAAQVEQESVGKLPTEEQQAQQSLIDVGGVSTARSRKRDRKQGGPLARNMERLKSAMAKFPAPKDRTKQQQAEFEELAAALQILERKPRSARENNKVNEALDKAGRYTTSGVDPNAKKRLSPNKGAKRAQRNKIARQDPDGTKVTRLKPKPLKFKWVAMEGQTGGSRMAKLKDQQAKMVQGITNKGLHVELSKPNQKYAKGVTWLAQKVQNLIPGTRIVVADKATLEQWRQGGIREVAALSNHLLGYPGPAMTYLHTMDTVVIRIDSMEDAFEANTLGLLHELGHAIHFKTWQDMGLEGQRELWEAFKADVKAGKRATGETLRGKPDPNLDPNIFEFKEWMADQFVIWMNNRKQPTTALQKFFKAFEKNLKKFYDLISKSPGRYGMELNQTYAEFADAVARRATQVGDPATDRFFPNNRVGSLGFNVLLGQKNSMELEFKASDRDLASAKQATNRAKAQKETKVKQSPYKGLELERWKEMLPKELTYNEIIRSKNQLVQLVNNLYQVSMAPSTSVMKTLSKDGIKAADKLVAIFNRHPGQHSVNYHQQVKRFSRGFMNRYSAITEGMSEADKQKLLQDLQTGTRPNSLRHRQMRKLFNDMHKYLTDAGLPVGKIENFVPKMFNKQLLLDNQEAIQIHYAKKYMKENQSTKREAWEWAKKKFNGLISQEAEQAAAEAELAADELSMQMPGFQSMRHRYTQSKFMDQFLETNLDAIVGNYVNRGVKRAEYNRALGSKAKKGLTGGDMIPRRLWNPQEKLDEIFDEAEGQGATDVQLMRMKNYVDANLGMYGRDDVSEGTRKFMAALVAYNNMRVLLFTVFASLPDMMGPVIRSNDAKTAFIEFSKNIKAIVNGASQSELAQMAEAIGVVTDTTSQHVLTEYVDNHYMPPTLRKWNDAFFKYTGLNWYTDATRKYALAVGIKSFENAAQESEMGRTTRQRNKAKKFLKEFGITAKDVRDWVKAGKPVYNSSTYSSQKGRRAERDNKIAAALVQFVDESIMSPNPSQRPIAASHPGLMLVYHLKGFMFAIYDVFLKRMKYNFDQARGIPEHMALAIPVVGMMVLTAAGMELRDLITGNDTRGKMDNWEYTWTLIERAGLLGPAQLGWDFEGAGDIGQSELTALAGPALDQVGDLISRPISQTIPKAIPVVSQLPWAREMLREGTPL